MNTVLMILLYNLKYMTLSLTLPPVQYQAQEPKLKSFIMVQSLVFDKCIPTLKVVFEVYFFCFFLGFLK